MAGTNAAPSAASRHVGFDDDIARKALRMQRPSNSVLMACALVVAVVGWMATGIGRIDASDDASESAAAQAGAAAQPRAPRVAVRRSQARDITREIVVSGRTEPNRVVELRAETDGRVVALGAERGATVAAGAAVVGLDVRDREARRDEARALIDYAELQLEAARKLKRDQFVSDTQMAELISRVAAARSALSSVELEIENTRIAAPFDAVVQDRYVELGDYVSSGDEVARLVDTDPLLVVGEVAERHVRSLGAGKSGVAHIRGTTPIEGTVRYLAPVADEGTRTFRVELAIPNAGGTLRGGLSAELKLAADEVTVHAISSALLALDDDGVVGVKAVDATNRVRFYPVDILSSSADGLLVTGLPPEIDLITVGQGYVRPGDLVRPVPDGDGAGLTDVSTLSLDAEAKR
jgi:multidrug efflux system membrane fusion protein